MSERFWYEWELSTQDSSVHHDFVSGELGSAWESRKRERGKEGRKRKSLIPPLSHPLSVALSVSEVSLCLSYCASLTVTPIVTFSVWLCNELSHGLPAFLPVNQSWSLCRFFCLSACVSVSLCLSYSLCCYDLSQSVSVCLCQFLSDCLSLRLSIYYPVCPPRCVVAVICLNLFLWLSVWLSLSVSLSCLCTA